MTSANASPEMPVMTEMATAVCIASKRIVQGSDGIKFVAFVSIAMAAAPG